MPDMVLPPSLQNHEKDACAPPITSHINFPPKKAQIEIYDYNIPIRSKEFLNTNVISGIFHLNIALEYFSRIFLSNILHRIFQEVPHVEVLHLW